MAAPERTAAVLAGLGAYAAGDFFEAHELMEPAWMGTDDPAERDLISGLIKVATAWTSAAIPVGWHATSRVRAIDSGACPTAIASRNSESM